MLVDLSHTPMADTFRRLSLDRKSGDLHVRSGKVAKTVFFDHGRIVFAASNLRKDRLGEALVALGRISTEDFSKVTAYMKGDRRRRFGDALVQTGVMDKHEIGRSVARQVRRIVLSLFEFQDGVGAFEERSCPIPLEYMVSVSIPRLVYEGIRLMKDQELVVAGLGNMDRWVTLAEVPPFPFDPKECSDEEREILEQARRKVTLRRLSWAPGGVTLSRLRTTYALLASGLLVSADQKATAAEPQVVQMETGTFLLSALRNKPDPSARQAIRLEVDEELNRSANLDREAWLKVSKSAPRDELVKALEEKMERYHALRDVVQDDEELQTDIELILGRAASMLRLARKSAEEAAAESPEEPPAFRGADDDSGSAVAAVSEPSPPPDPAEAGAPAPEAPVSSHVAAPSQMQIEHLLMEAEVRMTVSDYANAVPVYMKLVDLAPHIPAYRARLAIAMACYPKTAKQAEREFLEAVRLDPDNADIHYQFGLYYKAMRQRTRALAEMRTAVRLNPRHKLARQELEALSPRDNALKSLKKLFG